MHNSFLSFQLTITSDRMQGESQSQSKSTSVNANVAAWYVSASTSYSETDSTKESNTQSQSTKMEHIYYEGGKPNPLSKVLEPSWRPEIFPSKQLSLCVLLKKPRTKKACLDFKKSLAFCFNNLPDFADDDMLFKDMTMQLFTIQLHPTCREIGVPMFGKRLELREGQNQWLRKRPELKTQRSCAVNCASRSSCAEMSFDLEQGCVQCRVRPGKLAQQLMFDIVNEKEREYCENFSKDSNIDVKTNVVKISDQQFCNMEANNFKDTSHCNRVLSPCKTGDRCFTHVFKMPEQPVFSAQMNGGLYEQRWGLPLHSNDKILGPVLRSMSFGAMATQEDGKALCRYVNEKGLRARMNEAKRHGERSVHHFSSLVASRCQNLCYQTDKCDSMEVRLNWNIVRYGICQIVWNLKKTRSESESDLRDHAVEEDLPFFTRDMDTKAAFDHNIRPIIDAERIVDKVNSMILKQAGKNKKLLDALVLKAAKAAYYDQPIFQMARKQLGGNNSYSLNETEKAQLRKLLGKSYDKIITSAVTLAVGPTDRNVFRYGIYTPKKTNPEKVLTDDQIEMLGKDRYPLQFVCNLRTKGETIVMNDLLHSSWQKKELVDGFLFDQSSFINLVSGKSEQYDIEETQIDKDGNVIRYSLDELTMWYDLPNDLKRIRDG